MHFFKLIFFFWSKESSPPYINLSPPGKQLSRYYFIICHAYELDAPINKLLRLQCEEFNPNNGNLALTATSTQL